MGERLWIENYINNYNKIWQKQLKKTIFADVKAITSPENAGKVDVVDTPLTEIPSDGLPF